MRFIEVSAYEDPQFLRLTGVKRRVFERMVEVLWQLPQVERRGSGVTLWVVISLGEGDTARLACASGRGRSVALVGARHVHQLRSRREKARGK